MLARLGGVHVVRVLRVLACLLGIAAGVWVLAVAALAAFYHFWLIPNLDRVDSWVEAEATRLLGQPVSIDKLSLAWRGLSPVATVDGLSVGKATPLTVGQVVLEPSWSSVLEQRLLFTRLDVSGLDLALRRDEQGRLWLNGMALQSGDSQPGAFPNWLLKQSALTLNAHRVTWLDELAGVPELEIAPLRLELSRGLFSHKLRVEGKPDSRYLGGFRLGADWRGDDVNRWREWSGSLKAEARQSTFAWWERYVPALPLKRGKGSSTVELRFADGALQKLDASVQVEGMGLEREGEAPLNISQLSGQLRYRLESGGEHTLEADKLILHTGHGALMDDGQIRARWSEQGGQVSGRDLRLEPLLPALGALGLLPPGSWRDAALSGGLPAFRVDWKGALDKAHDLSADVNFQALGWQAVGGIPGVSGGLSGALTLSRNGGRLKLDASALTLNAPLQFKKPWHLNKLAGELALQRQGEGWRAQSQGLTLQTPDFSGSVSGSVDVPADGAPQARLQGKVERVALVRVTDYLPLELGEATLHWLGGAVQGGEGVDASFTLNGDLSAFPFAKGQGGVFRVDAALRGGALRFDPAWPAIERINGRLSLLNDNVTVSADSAQTQGVALSRVSVRLPDLETSDAQLLIDGKASGALSAMLGYTVKSPVDGWLSGFLGRLRAGGAASLDLGIRLPLDAPEQAKVQGRLALAGNTLGFGGLPIPEATAVRGQLGFNELGVDIPGLELNTLGGRFHLQARTDAKGVGTFEVRGRADTAKALAQYVPELAPFASGSSDYRVDFILNRGELARLSVDSSLQGTRLQAPAPAAKEAGEAWPLRVDLGAERGGLRVAYRLDDRSQGQIRLSEAGDFVAAGIGVGRAVEAPARGVLVGVKAERLDADAWAGALGEHKPGAAGSQALPPLRIQLATPLLVLGGKRLDNVDAEASLGGKGVQMRLNSRQASGTVDYQGSGRGKIAARLQRLALPLDDAPGAAAPGNGGASPRMDAASLPDVDLRAERVTLKGVELGALSSSGSYQNGAWRMEEMRLDMPEGVFRLSGQLAEKGAAQRTVIDVDFRVSDLGRTLAKAGYPDTVVGGKGKLSGSLDWPGQLYDFELARLSGQLQLSVAQGRFAKVDPGVARLLGVLSLQSLARRVRFDFTDVFSGGFAFDTIEGKAQVKNGVFTSQDGVRMVGPGASVQLTGQVDLPRDAQQVLVRITPNLSESVALVAGAALLNPVLGVATLAAQKALKDPINKVFSFEYELSGSLSEPQVKRREKTLLPAK